MRLPQSLHPPGLQRAFAPAARPFALATLLALSLVLATVLFTARTLQGVQVVTARTLTATATDLDLLHELRAHCLHGVATVGQLALDSDPAAHTAGARTLKARSEDARRIIALLLQRLPPGDARTSVAYVGDLEARLAGRIGRGEGPATPASVDAARSAARDALPLLQAMVARLDRAIAGQRSQLDEQGRAALHALAMARTQLLALAALSALALLLAALWRSRLHDPATQSKTPLPFPAGAFDAAVHAARRAAARQAVQTRMLSRSSSRRTTS